MRVTGSLQQKGSVYYAVLRIPADKGGFKQKWESTKVKAGGKSPREEIEPAVMLGLYLGLR